MGKFIELKQILSNRPDDTISIILNTDTIHKLYENNGQLNIECMKPEKTRLVVKDSYDDIKKLLEQL